MYLISVYSPKNIGLFILLGLKHYALHKKINCI